jgi:hypothetical protein
VTQVSGSSKIVPATRSPVSPPVFIEERIPYNPPVVRSVRLVTSLIAVLVTVLSGFVLGLISKSKQ